MSAEQMQASMARLARQNAVMTGLVGGIISCLGMGLIAAGMLGMALHEPELGFLGFVSGACFIGLAAHITQR